MDVAIGAPAGAQGLPPGDQGPPGYSPSDGYLPPGGFGPGGFGPPPGAPPPGPYLTWTPTDALGFGWNAVSKDFAGVALPIAVATFLMSLPAMLVDGVGGLIWGVLVGSGSVSESSSYLMNLLVFPLSFAVALASQGYFMGGIVRFSLRVARGEKPAFGDVFSGGPTFVPMIVGQFLFSAGSTLGILLCVVPGVIFALGCQFFGQFVVDKRVAPVDALKASWQLTQGQRVQLGLLALLVLGVFLLGIAACCVGALLVSVPVAALASAYVYLKLTGEPPISAA